jgi:outer membrane lipoprotein-sorting protein
MHQLLLAFLLILPGAVTPDAQALLRASDRARNGWTSFTTRIKITTLENGKSDEEHLYLVYQKGVEKTYVEFLSPREKGRHLLMLGDDMWVYLPDTSRPVRITPLERLAGDASNGDVARTNYDADYTPVYERSEKVDDVPCHVLELTAKRKGSTYHRIEYWVREDDARPVKADFYLVSGKHIKSATFDAYAESVGKVVLKRMTIYDQVRKTSHSVMEYQEYSAREIPDKLFNQSRTGPF